MRRGPDTNEVLLVQRPGRHFPPVAEAQPELVEGLLVPFRILGQPVGTVWALSHDDQLKFDREEPRERAGDGEREIGRKNSPLCRAPTFPYTYLVDFQEIDTKRSTESGLRSRQTPLACETKQR